MEPSPSRPRRVSSVQTTNSAGLWFAGWLFTIGFLRLTFWKAVLAIIVWPYFLGAALAK